MGHILDSWPAQLLGCIVRQSAIFAQIFFFLRCGSHYMHVCNGNGLVGHGSLAKSAVVTQLEARGIQT